MWSKRTETRKQNMTSFKSKITRRKRKLSNSRGIKTVQFQLNDLLNNTDDVTNTEINIKKCNGKIKTASGIVNSETENRKEGAEMMEYDSERVNTSAGGSKSRKKTTGKTKMVNSEMMDFESETVNTSTGGSKIHKKSPSGMMNHPSSKSLKKSASLDVVDKALFSCYNEEMTDATKCVQTIKAADEKDGFNSDIDFVNWPNDCDVSNNCGVRVITSENCDDNIQVRMKTHIASQYPSARRHSDNYVIKNNYRDKIKTNSLLTRSRSGINIDHLGYSGYDSSKRCDVIRNNHTFYTSSVPVLECEHFLNREYFSSDVCPKEREMQYSVRTDVTDKTKTVPVAKENKRVKNKKKPDKSKPNEIVREDNKSDKKAVNNDKKPTKNKKKETSDTNSYLKRVKSKIYKNRSDSSASSASANSNSSGQEIVQNAKMKKVKDKKNAVQNNIIPMGPITEHIYQKFPPNDAIFKNPGMPVFLRQSSNLERVRPRTFGLRTSASNIGISDLVDSTTNILNVPVETPKLQKSKSSSAINLNLLRTRRPKILEQAKKSSKNADTEFEFFTYGAVNTSVTVARKFGSKNPPNNISEEPSSWIFGNGGDRQPGQPVSRSSSDKRPDAVTEEVARTNDGHDVEPDTDISHDNVHSVTRAKSSQPAINRSESYKEQSQKRRQIRERRKISDPNLSKSNDVDSDHQELSYHSGSSSNSSLSSSRSSESPQSTSLDTVPGCQAHVSSTTAWDSDVDIEPDPPDWQSSVSEEILSRLHPEEKKRQEIINELFHTERSHVRNLRVLETVFYRPLMGTRCLPPDQVRLLFPNLEEMLDIHAAFNQAMKARRKEEAVVGDIGELLLNMFDGPAGENFQRAAATFCARQQLALESLKERRRKDARLHSFLTDCESDKLCKRLQLKDIIPTGMQRLVKYPLLFESLARCTERVLDSTMTETMPSSCSPTSAPTPAPAAPTPLELTRLKRAVERSKEILNYVNQAVKEAEDNARLQDIQKKLDKSGFDKVDHPIAVEFRNLDVTKHKLIHEGPLHWRLNKQNKLSVHVVLLEEVILLLQKQEEKYILKFYSSNNIIHSPIVKVSTVLVRHNATEKESLYLVNTSQNGAQIYDLAASTTGECKIWFKHISDAAEAYKCREGKTRRSELSTPEPETESTGADSTVGDVATSADTDSSAPSGDNSQRNSSLIDDESDKRLSQGDKEPDAPIPAGAGNTDGNGNGNGNNARENAVGNNARDNAVGNNAREAHMRVATDDQPLIQPCEVTVNVFPVHTALPVITPIEQVRRKDEAIRQALAEKEALVAEILHVPHEDYHHIADMAGENTGDKEPTELVLAAINQANQLWSVVSESLNVSDSDTVLATSSSIPVCASSPPKNQTGALPSIPSHQVHDIASTLNTQLTALLKVVREREDERERMRRELQKLREQVHTMHEAQLRGTVGACAETETACADVDIFHSAGDLANIEEDP